MSYRSTLPAALIVSWVLGYLSAVSAETIHVPADHATIQEAMDKAADGDEVVVVPGTYVELIDFKGKAIILRSSSNDPANTIINAGGAGRVVSCIAGETAATVLRGFTITGGKSDLGGGMFIDQSNPTITHCTFTGNTADDGGGLYNKNANPTITDCTFSGNTAFWGGGLHNNSESKPTIKDCAFRKNKADWGGGMFNDHSNPMVDNCTFSGNTTAWGGGMFNYADSSPTIIHCTFSDNTAEWSGGMYNVNSNPTITHCLFRGNTADWGGGMYNGDSNPTITNCAFSGNTAKNDGGGIYNYTNSRPTIINCTFNGNRAKLAGGIYNFNSTPTVINSILWGNNASEKGNEMHNLGTSAPQVHYSCIQGGLAGDGNIKTDPLFVDADGPDNNLHTYQDNDLRLTLDSPCRDAGNNNATPKGVKKDLEGKPRIAGAVVDMGAYEFHPTP